MNEHNLPTQHLQYNDDEIDLKQLFLALWTGKWIIILSVCLFTIGGVLFALSKPNIYKAEVILASTANSKSAGLASQLGGLASLAGINLSGSGGTDDKAMALAILQSRQFINAFIRKYNLLVPLMAGEKWDEAQDKLIINSKIYNSNLSKWVQGADASKPPEPTDWVAYKAFKNIISISDDKNTGLTILSITHLSPTIAKQWVESLVTDLNAWVKKESLDETRRNISYLEEQIGNTNIADMQSVFYELIEEQTKNLMLAEVQNEFAFKIIDPAVVPEEKVGPKRALICILAALLGGMLGMTIVLIRFAFNQKK